MTKILPHDPAKAHLLTQYDPARRDAPASPKDLSTHAGAEPQRDRAEISTRAQELVDLRQAVDSGRAALVEEPDVRADRVAEVKERLASGFYQSAEVRDQVAGRLTDMFLDHPLF